MNPIPIILDGDPGHDDAMAWMLAQSSPLLDIRAVTSSCGNQTIEKTTYNALRVMTLLGIDAPMAKGRSGPLVAKAMNAPTVHGPHMIPCTISRTFICALFMPHCNLLMRFLCTVFPFYACFIHKNMV